MQLWTYEHAVTLLPAVAVMLLLAAVLRITLRKKSFEIRMLPLKIIGVLIVILEIGKQYVSFSGGYDLYHIPLHYCSLFIFMIPLMAFYRGKHQDKLGGITVSESAVAGVQTVTAASAGANAADAVEALVAFGYSRSEASLAVGRLDSSLSAEELIRLALKALAKF